MKIDFKNIYLFKNGNLYATENEIRLKIEALKELIEDDESSIKRIQKNFANILKSVKTEEMDVAQQDSFESHIIDREQII